MEFTFSQSSSFFLTQRRSKSYFPGRKVNAFFLNEYPLAVAKEEGI